MIWIGTSGFQYPEWKGTFYPATLSAAKMLPYYAARFATTEINYTFNRVPSLKSVTNWAASTPEKFRFSFKAPKEITHVRRLNECAGVLGRFADAIRALDAKLGVVLFQLPPFFKKDLPRLEEFLRTLPEGLASAFEFRHASWFADDVFAALKARRVALCIAESDALATPVEFTAPHAYFRLRREDYTRSDIGRWAGIIRDQHQRGGEAYVYFKHEERGVGPEFARRMSDALHV